MEKRKPVGILAGLERRFLHQLPNREVRHQQPVELLLDQFRGLAAEHDPGSPQMRLQLIQRRFHLPALLIQRGQFLGRGFLVVQNRRQQTIDRLAVWQPFEAVCNHPHRHSVRAPPPVPPRRIDAAEVGAVGQAFLAGKHQILLDAPEQIGARGPRLAPQRVAEEIAVGQAQHPLAQVRQHLLGEGDFAAAIGAHAGAEQHLRSRFDQRDESQLRIGATATARSRTPVLGCVALLVGNIEGAAIHAHQTPLPIPGALARSPRDGLDHLIMELPQRGGSQPRPRLGDPRVARHSQLYSRLGQPLQPFQQAPQHFPVGRLHVQGQGDDVVDDHLSGQVALPLAGLARRSENSLNLPRREGLGDHTEADVIADSRTFG